MSHKSCKGLRRGLEGWKDGGWGFQQLSVDAGTEELGKRQPGTGGGSCQGGTRVVVVVVVVVCVCV